MDRSEHPSREFLAAYARGHLQSAELDHLERHLAACESCRDSLSGEAVAVAAGVSEREESVAAAAAEEILTSVQETFSTHSRSALRSAAPRTKIGKYEVIRRLGQGGQAVTYLANDPDLNRQVVIKEYYSSGNPIEQEAVLNEGRALARVQSDYVARCLTVDRIGRNVYLIMEYIRGENLSVHIRGEARDYRAIARLVEQVAEGLYDVHQCGILHRDIKPENIVIMPDGTPRLVDFRLAVPMTGEGLEHFGGTLLFMSPEQARNDSGRIDTRSDVFGLGGVLYWLLTGRPPYQGRDRGAIWEQAKQGQFENPRQLCPDAPARLVRICEKAMARQPADRYGSAHALGSALRRFLRDSALPSTDSTPEESRGSAQPGANPYGGLASFTEADAHLFFGRDAQIERLWSSFRKLHTEAALEAATPRLLAVLGPSGSGKSSLARAGLLAELQRRPLPGRAAARYVTLTPGNHPLESLALALARLLTGEPSPAAKSREFEELLSRVDAAGNYDGLRRLTDMFPDIAAQPLVIFIDQFEETYSLCKDQAVRTAFIATLLDAVADPAGRASAVITLRSDFLGETQDDSRLNLIIAEQGLIVPAMTADELRRAIAEPARQAGRPLEDAVVDLLIEDTKDREGALPLLQFTLARIWDGLRAQKQPADTFREIGGVGGALAGEAERIYSALGPQDQIIARRAFLAMVQLGEGTRDHRRPRRLAALRHRGLPLARRRAN